MKQIARFFTVVFASSLLSGCSTFSFLFERLDWLVNWKLDQMFELRSDQEDVLRTDVLQLQSWMREEGFPATIRELESLVVLWEQGRSEAAYEHLMVASRELRQRYLSAMHDGVIRFSLSLDERNAARYREYAEAQMDEWFESTRSVEDKVEREVERLEDWFGHLSDQQVRIIADWASLVANEREIRIRNHVNWREAYLQAALDRDAQGLSSWLGDLSLFWTADYRHLRAHNHAQRKRLVFELFPTLSPRQRQHASEYVQEWIASLKEVLD